MTGSSKLEFGHLALLAAVLFAQVLLIVESQQLACRNVSLSDVNQTFNMTPDLIGNGTSPPYAPLAVRTCWNITAPERMQLRVTCQYDTGRSGDHAAWLSTPEVRVGAGYLYPMRFEEPNHAAEVFSCGNNVKLTVGKSTGEAQSAVSCLVRPVPDESDAFCGSSQINFTTEYLFNLSVRGNRFLHCAWRVTSDGPSAFTKVDLFGIHTEDMSIELGEGDHIGSSLVHWIGPSHKNGTSYFLSGARIWMTFSSFPLEIVNATPTLGVLLRSSNFTSGEVPCEDDQVLCRRDSKCLPLHSLCDGQADCSDFLDEGMKCDFCGAASIFLSSEESTTIVADFGEYFPGTGYFAVYPGDWDPLPPANTSEAPAGARVAITNHTRPVAHRECVWQLREPNGTRIRAEVAEFEGYRLVLTVGNGADPAGGVRLLVIDTESGVVPLPRTLWSVETGMWITLKESTLGIGGFKLRLVFSTYQASDCDEGQFACPSGGDCLAGPSLQCDGRRDCPANGDELGCGNCGPDEFLCSSGQECVPGYQLCDGRANCADYADELLCGFCGNETVNIRSNRTYLVEPPYSVTMQCLWVIVAEPGLRIQARILRTSWCQLVFATVYADADGAAASLHWGFLPGRGGAGRVVLAVDAVPIQGLSTTAYPRSVSVATSQLWISNRCVRNTYQAHTGRLDRLVISVRQYVPLECSPDEFSCTDGLACIEATAVCDGIGDCPEYSDEVGCAPCLDSEFACASGDCVALEEKCDGEKQCADFSDEFDCDPCGRSVFHLTKATPATLTSPGWWEGDVYPDRSQCLWKLVSEVGSRIAVTFREFAVEEGYDNLYLGNGNTFADYFLNVTGDRFPHKVVSRENTMFVIFVTDVIIGYKGFLLEIEQTTADEVTCDEGYVPCGMMDLVCVRNDASNNGLPVCPKVNCDAREYYVGRDPVNLTSPGYPADYPSGLRCDWTVISGSNKTGSVLVRVLDFRTERGGQDVLEFQGSTRRGGEGALFRLGGDCKVRSLAFNSSAVRVAFTTDATVSFRGFRLRLLGNFSANNVTSCPDSDLFDCGDGSCVSPDARCDGFRDCYTDGSDELNCDNVSCLNYFKCSNSGQCLHWDAVCDGTPDCPSGDDETNLECGKKCPVECECDMPTANVKCLDGWNASTVKNIARKTASLYLSGGYATVLDVGLFKDLSHLRGLWLPGNNITGVVKGTFSGLHNLTYLDISENNITTIAGESFFELSSLQTLIARDIYFDTIESKAFNGLASLKTLVLLRSTSAKISEPVDVKPKALGDLVRLVELYVDDYRLCCEFHASIGAFRLDSCKTTEATPPMNLCGSLMQNDLLRVSMWALACSALVGNAAVVVWRSRRGDERGSGKRTHALFVMNLAVSDLLMGVYMLIIAGADLYFGEAYSRVAKQWRASPPCKIAGVLSVLSSEASVFFVTLISLDSFLAIVFPFSRVRLRGNSAAVAVATVWALAVTLSVAPNILSSDDSRVYGLSDVCIGLPLMTKPKSYVLQETDIGNPLGSYTVAIPVGQGSQPIWTYSIVLFLGINLLCFLVVLVCYVAIFVKVKRTARRVRQTAHRDREIKMAVKMALIVGTDFACWMPVIVMGILSQSGAVDIGAEAYAWVVVLVLPINSSLNPYIYTLITAVSECRQAKAVQEEKLVLTTAGKTRSLETVPSTGSDNVPS